MENIKGYTNDGCFIYKSCKFKGSIPKFIIGFTIVIVLNNFGFIPQFIVDIFKSSSKLFLLLAMAAIGLKVSISTIFNYGSKVFLVALISFVIQVYIAIQFVT